MHAQPSRSTLRTALACLCLASVAAACTPELGDDCSNSLNCSSQSSRECDRTQPGGYCTISPCERGTCPEEATCVKFRPSQERLSVTYCMRKCSENNDCRDDEGYRCLTAKGFSACYEAETLDGEDRHFCALPSANAPVEDKDKDAGVDGGVDAGVDAGMSCMPTPSTAP